MALVTVGIASTQAIELLRPPPLVGLVLALSGIVGLVGYLVLPGAAFRVALAPLAPGDERFRLRRLGLQFGATEGRALGAILFQLLIVAVAWLPMFVACIVVTPIIGDALLWLRHSELGGFLRDLRPPTRRELDFACLAFISEIISARLILIPPNAAMDRKMAISGLWRATSNAWLKLSTLVFAMSAGWWLAAAVGAPIGNRIATSLGLAGVVAWTALAGFLAASAFAFQISTSVLIFRQLVNDRLEARA